MAGWKTKLGLTLSGFGILLSFSSFVFFFYGNYHAAGWALISGLISAVDFHLLFLHWRRTLGAWHSPSTMNDIEILALIGLILGLGATAWYIFSFIYYNLPILPVPDSYQIAAVWSFMTAKYSLGLFLSTKHLATELREQYPELLRSTSYYRSPNYYARISAPSILY